MSVNETMVVSKVCLVSHGVPKIKDQRNVVAVTEKLWGRTRMKQSLSIPASMWRSLLETLQENWVIYMSIGHIYTRQGWIGHVIMAKHVFIIKPGSFLGWAELIR